MGVVDEVGGRHDGDTAVVRIDRIGRYACERSLKTVVVCFVKGPLIRTVTERCHIHVFFGSIRPGDRLRELLVFFCRVIVSLAWVFAPDGQSDEFVADACGEILQQVCKA